MSTALATVDNGSLSGGIGLQPQGQMKPTYIILRQPTHEGLENVPIGRFVHRDTGNVWKELKIVLLNIQLKRAKMPSAKYVQGERPLCKSANGLVPITDNADLVPQAANCNNCEHSTWKYYDKASKTGAPSCRKSYELLFIEQETGEGFKLVANGRSTKPVEALHSTITQSARMYAAKNKVDLPNLFDFVVTMDAVKMDGSPAYMLRFPQVQLMSKEQAADFGPLHEALVKRAANQVEPEVEDDAEFGI